MCSLLNKELYNLESKALRVVFIKDLLKLILDFLGTFNDFKNLRSVSKYLFEQCMKVWKSLKVKKEVGYPRSTFVIVNRCHICNIQKDSSKFIQLYVLYKATHIDPVYVICGSLQCVHDCTMSYYSWAWDDKIIILNDNSLPKKSIIPRSNKEIITNANIGSFVRLSNTTGKLVVLASWIEEGEMKIKHIFVTDLKGDVKISIPSFYKDLEKNTNNFEEIGLKVVEIKEILDEKS